MPKRIQRKRHRGWRMPAGTISVTRPGGWGNPFKIAQDKAGWWCMLDRENGLLFATEAAARSQSIQLYCEQLTPQTIAAAREFLRGHDLACWCQPAPAGISPRTWCHADRLIEIANG